MDRNKTRGLSNFPDSDSPDFRYHIPMVPRSTYSWNRARFLVPFSSNPQSAPPSLPWVTLIPQAQVTFLTHNKTFMIPNELFLILSNSIPLSSMECCDTWQCMPLIDIMYPQASDVQVCVDTIFCVLVFMHTQLYSRCRRSY